MAKSKSTFICKNCGYSTSKWLGKCPECGEWNSFEEELVQTDSRHSFKPKKNNTIQLKPLSELKSEHVTRVETSIEEFDKVLGGGFVNSSVILFSGEPGIGKSTFILQICDSLKQLNKILYISGEESSFQVKKRATRLGLRHLDKLFFQSSVNLEEIDVSIQSVSPDLVIIDSIQTVYHPDLESAPGNVSQVRECASHLFRLAKENNFILVLIGHVTKDGNIAGPKILEHLVDVVLHLEGDHRENLRIIRSRKNRYGNTMEMAVFTMTGTGLQQIKDTSHYFLQSQEFEFSGTSITALYESRVLLMEIQALVSKTPFGMPQRTVMGFDHKRLSLIIAILEKRLNVMLKNHDVFIKMLGGIKIDDPAEDMAVIMSILSSYYDFIVPSDTVYIGEVGLGGEFRSVSQIDQRIQESARLKFKRIFIPSAQAKNKGKSGQIEVIPVKSVQELLIRHKHLITGNQ
ncbi:MAG: DNA repair protein RadA [Calditrichia bacterium]